MKNERIFDCKQIIQICLLVALLAISAIIIKSLHDKTSDNEYANEVWDYRDILTPFKPTRRGYSILVDLDILTLTLYKDGNEERQWPISGGTIDNPSPIGSWIVTDIENWGSGFGGSWIGLNVPWGQYGIHGTTQPWAVGCSNVSHGCIRMRNADVAELKEIISIGILVHVKYDNIPFRILAKGEIGSDILVLQVILMQLGYISDIPDGKFGMSTFNAVIQFQIDENLKPDGVVGIQTWILLRTRVDEL
ncbi:MAG: L,D-transpeptidase family protein [Defluviitaleaceae bacterium]|nr:L,D-transpeptidase family protein [Defluviitaleaceae bacterium]